jgi:hypothetical protein
MLFIEDDMNKCSREVFAKDDDDDARDGAAPASSSH